MIVKKVNLSRAALLGVLMLGTVNWLGEDGLAGEAQEWSGFVMPYLFPFGFDGKATVDGREADVDFGLDNFFETVHVGGFIRAEVWNEQTWGLILDGGMTWLKEDFKVLDRKVGEATFRWLKFDLMLARRLVDKKVGRRNRHQFAIDAYGGLRMQYLRDELRQTTGEYVGNNATWAEPVVGARVARQASSVVTILAEGDASGFGIGNASKLTWNFRAGADIDLSGRLGLRLVYNLTGIDYSKGSGSTEFGLDGVAHGPMIGLIFSF